ncbi:hypothetical protein [Fuerstiella marisgermanici]|uniref:Uncharacterized protein n=1 Tax=Fuerstiella marisgermanici TaxID=1891926 RepID=A0A1P8WKB8_9PLAN|nr:hypothetical protein [Fuerstiella marisgermanici]APZ94502.1 hypothetical protein Fuma_04134 [Fuerstiella marisgermanici]
MNAHEFIQAVKLRVIDAAADGVLKNLKTSHSRSSTIALQEISKWFNGLSNSDQRHVAKVVQMTAHSAAFGLFCVIDGVRVVESGPEKSEFRLMAISANGSETTLNPDDGEMLHDLLNALDVD